MKIKLFAALLAGFMTLLPLTAREKNDGYTMYDILSGKVVSRKQMTRTSAYGSRLSGLRLSEFESVSFEADETLLKTVSDIVMEARKEAESEEIEMRGDTLIYAFLTVRPKSSNVSYHHYFGYQATPVGRGRYKVTILSLYGLASVAELREKLCL